MSRNAGLNEAEEQKILVRWLTSQNIMHFSVPNEARRSVRLAARLKAMGMTAGVPDIILVTVPPIGIELKTAHRRTERNGGLSDKQRAWHTAARKRGWVVHTAYGARHAIDFVTDTLG